jgi:methylated-DNA-[protein]-cysteine S-methyltransferase
MTFADKIYAVLKKVPRGRVTTYKELAKAVHSNAYRAVGAAMRCNLFAPKIPCHRVIKSDGSIGGYKGKMKGKAIQEKIWLLKKEGVSVKRNKINNFKKIKYEF